jgi:hypothetical protein
MEEIVTYQASPGLLAVADEAVCDMAERNLTLGIDDADDYFYPLDETVAYPRTTKLDTLVASLKNTRGDVNDIANSRLRMLSRLKHHNLDDSYIPMLVALHLRHGEPLWNNTSFHNATGLVIKLNSDDSPKFCLDENGKLTVFGVSLIGSRDRALGSLAKLAGRECNWTVTMGELTHYVQRSYASIYDNADTQFTYASDRMTTRYRLNSPRMLFMINKFVDDDSAVSWFFAYLNDSKFQEARDSEFTDLLEFLSVVGPSGRFDELAPVFIEKRHHLSPRVIAEMCNHDIDEAITESLFSYNG